MERLEELVEKISGCYTTIPVEILNELNDLTKNDWSEEEYIEFCAEYWSRSNLEETVYALLHGGEYPKNVECDLYFWDAREAFDIPDMKIMLKLRKTAEKLEEDFVCDFEDVPIKQFYEWLCSYFSDWSIDKTISEEEMQMASFTVSFDSNSVQEYATYKYIRMKVKNKKLIQLDSCNLSANEKQDIISFANQYNLHVYEG